MQFKNVKDFIFSIQLIAFKIKWLDFSEKREDTGFEWIQLN